MPASYRSSRHFFQRFSRDRIEHVISGQATPDLASTFDTVSRSTSTLCENCKAIILRKEHFRGNLSKTALEVGDVLLDFSRTDSFPQFPELKESAANGCQLCSALIHLISEEQRKHNPKVLVDVGKKDPIPLKISLRYRCVPSISQGKFGNASLSQLLVSIQLQRTWFNRADYLLRCRFSISCDDDPKIQKHLNITRRRAENLSIEERLCTVRKWIRHCHSDHTACGNIAQETRNIYPKRLVWIPSVVQMKTEHPKLIFVDDLLLTVDGKSVPAYVALSYCWGSTKNQLITTQINERTMMKGIPWDMFPATLRDALKFTQTMNISYIWIDSLCILQNDKQNNVHSEEFNEESEKMGDIYRNAYITLATVNAASTEQAVITERSATSLVRVPFTTPQQDAKEGCFYLSYSSENRPRFQGKDMDDFILDVEQSVWNTRGWTFQERLLSPRILYIGKRQMHYVCRLQRLSEDRHGDLKQGNLWKLLLDDPVHSHLKDKYMLDSAWHSLMRAYCHREFTFPADRLPALKGLATEFSRAYSNSGIITNFMSGLWKHSLWQDLLWLNAGPKSPHHDLGDFGVHAPSWSWCNLPININWLDVHDWSPVMSLMNSTKAEVLKISTPVSAATDRGHAEEGYYGGIHLRKLSLVYFLDGLERPADEKTYSFACISNCGEETAGLVLKQLGNGHYERRGYFVATGRCWQRHSHSFSNKEISII